MENIQTEELEIILDEEGIEMKDGGRTGRPSPSDSATIYDEGYIKRGGDGNLWKIVVASNNVQRWQKLRPEEQSQYEEGDYYGKPSVSGKSSTFAKEQKTAPMDIESKPVAQQVNNILTKTFFHYHVGDTISSAIGQPFFWKGKIFEIDDGRTLLIRLEPQRQLKTPDWKYVMIAITLNSMDEFDISVTYDEFKNGLTKKTVLWEHKGVGIQMSEIPGLDSIIGGHKAEMKENFEKAQEIKETEKKTDMAETEEVTLTTEEVEEAEKKVKGKDVEDLINGQYGNAYELNLAIQKVIDLIKAGKGDLTAEAKQFISQYAGMGGMAKYGAKGRELLYEYYTPDEIIMRMWGLAYKHGYKTGQSVLEPAVGTGRFLKYLTEETRCLALECNSCSKFIAQALYGHKAEIKEMYFEQLFIKNNSSIKDKISGIEKFDLVIGNPPYGDFGGRYAGMGERVYTKAKNYVDYFILRGLDCLNPGGLLIYVIGVEVAAGGTAFLDQQVNAAKEAIAKRGELIDAYRLPSDIFERTGVSTDIVVFRKS